MSESPNQVLRYATLPSESPRSRFSNNNEIISVVLDYSDFWTFISDQMGSIVNTKEWTLPNIKTEHHFLN